MSNYMQPTWAISIHFWRIFALCEDLMSLVLSIVAITRNDTLLNWSIVASTLGAIVPPLPSFRSLLAHTAPKQ